MIRHSKPDDLSTLYKLARMVYFINLPPDEKIIAAKIAHSRACFGHLAGKTTAGERADAKAAKRKSDRATSGLSGLKDRSDVFMFSIVDTRSGGVIGTSQIISRMGGPGRPNWSLKLTEKKFFSKGLNFGTTHTVARLHGDESGPSEVGGLIIAPSHRGARGKPGKFLSFVRFHLVGLYPERFSDRIIAEMAAPVSPEGDNAFWDAVCRKFIPVKYAEADRFCQHNRDFIPELLPKDDLYLTLLPLEVLNQVAQVGEETRPARRMLENLGFEYKHHIDPFDGGPHLEAATRDVTLVKSTRRVALHAICEPEEATHSAVVSAFNDDGEFRAVFVNVRVDRAGQVSLAARVAEMLGVEPGDALGLTIVGPEDEELDDHEAAERVPVAVATKPRPGPRGKPTAKPAAVAVKPAAKRKVKS